mgnify:FL=1
MSFQEQLDAIRDEELAKTPGAVREIMAEAQRYLRETGVGGGVLAVGQEAPDFTLPDVDGRAVSLHETCRRGPVILDFFRGGWCPFCSLELRAYERLIASIEHAGASLLAISPETTRHLRQLVRENELSFPVLSDADNAAARRYGLVYTLPETLRPIYAAFGLDLPERMGTSSFELPIPATFLVDRDRVVRRSFHDLDVTHRGAPEDFVAALQELRPAS